MTGAALRDILGDSRDAKCCILQYKIVSKMGRVRSRKRRVRDDDFIVGCGRMWSDVVGCGRMWSDYRRIVFLLAEAFRELPLKLTLLAPRIGNDVSYVTQISDDIDFAWQAQYLVRLEGDFTCSTHWK